MRIALDRRLFAAASAEAAAEYAARRAAYARWMKKLERTPTDSQMAAWLDYDRKCLMDEAMQHYKLRPSDTIAHTFIEAPAGSYKRARVPNGPWRYSRYKLLLFLLTRDGVRQMTVDLDFEKATFHGQLRLNYRFDAVAAVQVDAADSGQRTFRLSLLSGLSIDVRVTESDTGPAQPGEDAKTVSDVTLDVTGLSNTLHILEGIAAEGTNWIGHETERQEDRLVTLAQVVNGVRR
jgi:hypothetical protein